VRAGPPPRTSRYHHHPSVSGKAEPAEELPDVLDFLRCFLWSADDPSPIPSGQPFEPVKLTEPLNRPTGQAPISRITAPAEPRSIRFIGYISWFRFFRCSA